jgi:hypothetical protein
MKSVRESVLLKTSSRDDVQCSGGYINITGLKSIRKSDVTNIVQIKYRAAVAQVITVAGTAYTPTAGTVYAVAVYDPNRTSDGYQESQKVYKYTTPSDILLIGATAALQREAIHAALVTKINADASNHTIAASLGTGTGFTITDDTDYYPVRAQSMTNEKFVSTVIPLTNPDGSGFARTNFAVTTVGNTSFGVGAKLAQRMPVIDAMYGNLISGDIEVPVATFTNPPTYAVSGQNYDGFVIMSMKEIVGANVTGQYVYVPRESYIFVDNGSGSSTTNLAGFLTFEREMRKLILQVYGDDAATVQQWFDQDFVEQGLLGAAPATTAGVANKFLTPYGMLNHFNIGTQTIVTGTQAVGGFLMEQDATATEGAAYTAPIWTVNSQQFVVGKTEMTVNCKASFTTPANIVFMVGFRSKEAHQAAFASYQYLATVGTGAAGTAASTYGNLAAGTPVVTAAGFNLLTTVQYDFRVQIDINGVVSAYINNVKSNIYSVGTTPLVIPAGTILIPHMQYTNLNSAAAVPTILELWAAPSANIIF